VGTSDRLRCYGMRVVGVSDSALGRAEGHRVMSETELRRHFGYLLEAGGLGQSQR
jgi:hypothetical protein